MSIESDSSLLHVSDPLDAFPAKMNHDCRPTSAPSRLKHMQSHPSLRYSEPNIQTVPTIAQDPVKKRPQSNIVHAAKSNGSRTQHKLMWQRQSFLADDKNYLDHPANMRRLTKELDRVNREYRCVRHFEDPMIESFRRVQQQQQQQHQQQHHHQQQQHLSLSSSSSCASSWSSSSSSSLSSYRRSSLESSEVPGFLSRLFGHHPPAASSVSVPSSSQLKRYHHEHNNPHQNHVA